MCVMTLSNAIHYGIDLCYHGSKLYSEVSLVTMKGKRQQYSVGHNQGSMAVKMEEKLWRHSSLCNISCLLLSTDTYLFLRTCSLY